MFKLNQPGGVDGFRPGQPIDLLEVAAHYEVHVLQFLFLICWHTARGYLGSERGVLTRVTKMHSAAEHRHPPYLYRRGDHILIQQ